MIDEAYEKAVEYCLNETCFAPRLEEDDTLYVFYSEEDGWEVTKDSSFSEDGYEYIAEFVVNELTEVMEVWRDSEEREKHPYVYNGVSPWDFF